VAQLRDRLLEDRRAGHVSTLLLFYSGHGSRGADRAPSLALLDGPLTQAVLYDEVLARLPARYVHLLVDACHAEAVVRPRDAQAETVAVTPADAAAYASRTTLARFPSVGAIIATTTTAQSHEWDVYQRGVFSYQVLSGLRGAADVNHDQVIEYSELYAFLSAANRNVSDSRARLAVVARPPALDRRAPLVNLAALRRSTLLRLGAQAGTGPRRFYVEDQRGNRIADVHAEHGVTLALAIPAAGTSYLRTPSGEATLEPTTGRRIDLAGITLRPSSSRARGAMDMALRRGLFSEPFGPAYYSGFVDRLEDFIAVPLDTARETAPALDLPEPTPDRTLAWTAYGSAGALAAGAVVFSVLASRASNDYDAATTQARAIEASDRFGTHRTLAITTAAGAAIGAALGTWLLVRTPSARVLPGPGTGLALALTW
jgi:hypothetical protein